MVLLCCFTFPQLHGSTLCWAPFRRTNVIESGFLISGPWHSSHPQAFQEYQPPFALPKAKTIEPVCFPSQIWVHSQPKCYRYVSPLQLKRNMGGLDGPEESKRSDSQSIPSLPRAVAAKSLHSYRRNGCGQAACPAAPCAGTACSASSQGYSLICAFI